MDYGSELPRSESQRLEEEFIYIKKLFNERSLDDLNFTLGSQDPYGWTRLHYIMAKENIEIEPFLEKIEPEILEKTLLKRTGMGVTPFQLALAHQSDSNCEQLIVSISADAVCKIMLARTGDYTPLEYALMHRPYVADLLLNKLTAETIEKFLPSIIYDLARILPHDRLKLLLEQISPQIINQALLRTWSLFTISSVTNLKKARDQHNFIYLILVWAYSFLNAPVAEKEKANRLSELKDWWKLTHKVLGKEKLFSQTFKNHIENNTFFKTSWFYTNYRDIRNALLKVDNIDDEIIREALESYWDYLKLRKSITTDTHEKQIIEMLLSDQEPHFTAAIIADHAKESDKTIADKEIVEDITNSSPQNTF